ncbi:SWIM zinc finger family protein [Nocardioides sp. CFH 31398]|uniref:SWIM zinc finger family protein n=1 Tax=Nocardioides sp. CFH 31398 TaxID=2919579 RepID=UPI001F05E401|nr:SWIM zinc finger family protein [Nocardioides sp. CFH 31398]MCH1865615.1 SWIM zinc finger family protein [Nocardioides sp. CFH 31398]
MTHARAASSRGGRTTGWWAKAWLRAVEEAAYGEADLRRGRSLARSGRVGAVTVDGGSFVAAVEEGDDAHTVSGTVEVWDDVAAATLVEIVAARSGRVTELLAGELPLSLVEDAEEAGVELVPYAGELDATCTCQAWLDPCPHALAVLVVLSVLLDRDPLVLFHLRGLDREQLLARLHARTVSAPPGPDAVEGDDEGDLDVGLDAVLRAQRLLELVARGDTAADHLF